MPAAPPPAPASAPEAAPRPDADCGPQEGHMELEAMMQHLAYLKQSAPHELEAVPGYIQAAARAAAVHEAPAETAPEADIAQVRSAPAAVPPASSPSLPPVSSPAVTGEAPSDLLELTQHGVALSIAGLNRMNDDMVARGWKPQPVAVAFEGLRVTDNGTRDDVAPTVGRVLGAPLRLFCKRGAPAAEPTVRVGRGAGVTGYVNPGEMLLVMGPPGSGCSTLLKTLAGHDEGVTVEAQKLMYNGQPSLRAAGARGVYLVEEDIHLPQLTVEQTLRFAAGLGAPDEWTLTGMTREDFIDTLVRTMLPLLGLGHAAGTIVGDSILRGVSGGEKKRVSIGEAQSLLSTLLCLDGWSRGLDSAATLRICKQLRDVANVCGLSIVASMYQVGPEMLHPEKGFNNVLVLDGGRQLYFGPCAEAAAYCARLGLRCPPRRTLPDFLATVVDVSVQTAKEHSGGRLIALSESEQAAHSDALGNRWIESPELRAVQERLRGTGGRDVLPGSAYKGLHADRVARAAEYVDRPEPTSLSNQLGLLLWREFALIRADKQQYLYGRIGRSVFLGLINGAVFWDLGDDQSGAYSRMGVMYNVLLMVAFVSFGAIADSIAQRNVFFKQRDYGVIRPWMWFFVKFVSDLPLSLAESVVVGSLVYWMAGFAATFGQYVAHIAAIWVTAVCCGAVIRLMSTIAADIDMAMAYSAGACLMAIFFGGYMIPRDSIPVYWQWVHYISPLTYGFRAMLVNEFDGLSLNCSASELVKIEANGTAGTVCPLPADGGAYLRASLDITEDGQWVWWDILTILGILAVVLLLNAWAVGHSSAGSRAAALQFKRRNHRRTTVGSAAREGAADGQGAPVGELGEPYGFERASRQIELRWKSVTYSVPDDSEGAAEGGEKVLLHGIDGVARPGEMTALMGPSGAGKTTLMDVLALRKDPASTQGEITLNGAPLTPGMRRCIGYVEQMDMHQGRATVREALLFSARLRLADDVDRDAKVDEVIRLLGLEELQDAMIGDETTEAGLSLEARKRVTIGVELVAEPLVLFMDEPTSGLDTAGALAVLRSAKAVAQTGRTVVMTIHQPSTELFEMFDALCLLQAGGRLAYCGRVHGEGSTSGCKALLDYLSENAPDPADEQQRYVDGTNPADFVLNALASSRADWADAWAKSAQAAELAQVLAEQQQNLDEIDVPQPKSWCTQVRALYGRTMQVYWRTPTYNITRNVLALGTGLLLGSAYWQTGAGDSQKTLFNHVTSVFFIIMLNILTMMTALPVLFASRPVFYRESQSGMYNSFIFGSAMGTAELPFVAMTTVIFSSVTYWMCGFQADFDRFGYFLLMYFLITCFAVYFGQAVAALVPSLLLGQMAIPGVAGPLIMFSGFLIRPTDLAPWFMPLHYFNPFTYFLRSMVSNLLSGRTFSCEPGEAVPVPWTAVDAANCNPLDSKGALLGFDNSTDACMVCPITSAEQYLDLYGWDYSTRWTDVGILLAFVLAARISCQLLLRFMQHVKR